MSETKAVALREALADISHDIWTHWMRWQFSVCTQNEDGSLTIPAEKVARWLRQMGTDYADLSEREKDSDREQADKILVVLSTQTSQPTQAQLKLLRFLAERSAYGWPNSDILFGLRELVVLGWAVESRVEAQPQWTITDAGRAVLGEGGGK